MTVTTTDTKDLMKANEIKNSFSQSLGQVKDYNLQKYSWYIEMHTSSICYHDKYEKSLENDGGQKLLPRKGKTRKVVWHSCLWP